MLTENKLSKAKNSNKMKKRSILISFVLAYFFVGNFNLQAQDKTLQELEENCYCRSKNNDANARWYSFGN